MTHTHTQTTHKCRKKNCLASQSQWIQNGCVQCKYNIFEIIFNQINTHSTNENEQRGSGSFEIRIKTSVRVLMIWL